MASIKRFEDLEVWKAARSLASDIYSNILSIESIRDYPLKDQINRSSGSIMDNIAEGFERGGSKEFRQFLSIARASCAETKSQLHRGFDRNYIAEKTYLELLEKTDQTTKMINGMIRYLNSTELNGNKFKENTNQEPAVNQPEPRKPGTKEN